jgi:hypothetical protein
LYNLFTFIDDIGIGIMYKDPKTGRRSPGLRSWASPCSLPDYGSEY